MVVKLLVVQGDSSLKEVRLRRPRTVVGRKKGCKIRIRSDLVSRIHCSLVTQDGRLTVKGLGSSNGTKVNGMRVKEAALQAGDTLQVGPIKFLVQVIGVPASGERIEDEHEPTMSVSMGDDEVVFFEREDGVAGEGEPDLVDAEVIEEVDEKVELVRSQETHEPVPHQDSIFSQDSDQSANADNLIFTEDVEAGASAYPVADDPRTDSRKPKKK